MSKADKATEPSMDEILASIRKIIAEEPTGSRKGPSGGVSVAETDSEGGDKPGVARASLDDILGLADTKRGDATVPADSGKAGSRADAGGADKWGLFQDPAKTISEPGRASFPSPSGAAMQSPSPNEASGGADVSRGPTATPRQLELGAIVPRRGAEPANGVGGGVERKPPSGRLPDWLSRAAPVLASAADLPTLAKPEPVQPEKAAPSETRSSAALGTGRPEDVPRASVPIAASMPPPSSSPSGESAGARHVNGSVPSAATSGESTTDRSARGVAQTAVPGPVFPSPHGRTFDAKGLAPSGKGMAGTKPTDSDTVGAKPAAIGLPNAAVIPGPAVLAGATTSPVPQLGLPSAAGSTQEAASSASAGGGASASTIPEADYGRSAEVSASASHSVIPPVEPTQPAKVVAPAIEKASVLPVRAAEPAAVSKPALMPDRAKPPAKPAAGELVTQIGAGGGAVRTLDDTIIDLLRPMIRQWLDDNMPRMVEKALRVELAASLKGKVEGAGKGDPPKH